MTAPAPPTSQAAQAGLVIAMGAQLDAAFALIDVHRLVDTLPQFKLAVAAIVRRFGLASASLAATFYKDERRLAGILAPLTMKVADPPNLAQVDANISWATEVLWGPDSAINFESMTSMVTGATETMVLDTGRHTVIDTIASDRHARGWARVTEPNPCYFCALLATRGAVYTKESGSFEAHDHCRCHVEPVFTAYEPSAQIRQYQQLYSSIPHVNSSKGMQRAWRQAYEARYGRQDANPPTPQGEAP